MEKMTINQQYANIKAFLEEHDAPIGYVTFIEDRMAQVAKKNATRSNKPTKNQLANVELMSAIYDAMETGKRYRVSEIGKFDFLTEYTINKVNALVRGLKLDGRVVKTEEKGIAYFTKA